MNDTVLTGNDGPLRTITLNRPDKLNAFTAEMHLALRAALEAAGDDESSVSYTHLTLPTTPYV